ncbi:MAG: antA/AntB antirepressor family protein [Oscillospiraceae bacterium]|nr:antA/AntB antirepressor family protein [Oscillospiraceae bacterium]
MNELIKINYDSDRPTVLGRDLHKALEVKTAYKDWFPRMCEYGFTQNFDYTCCSNLSSEKQHGGQNKTDHQLTIEMAKEICMIQRSEKGKQCRQYFISVEEQFNNPQAIMARALRLADEELKRLTIENQIMKPKADYFDALVERNLLTSFRETAKQLGFKERNFVNFLIEKKYIYRDKRGRLMPYAEKNDGIFEVKECINEKTNWSGTQTFITPKGRETFRLLQLN